MTSTRGDRGRPIFGVPGSIFGVPGSIFGVRGEKSRNFGCSKKSVFLRGVGVPLTFEFSKIGSPSPMGGRPGVIFGVGRPSGGRPPRGSLRGGPGAGFWGRGSRFGGPTLGQVPGLVFQLEHKREIGWSAGEGWADSSRVLKTFFRFQLEEKFSLLYEILVRFQNLLKFSFKLLIIPI